MGKRGRSPDTGLTNGPDTRSGSARCEKGSGGTSSHGKFKSAWPRCPTGEQSAEQAEPRCPCGRPGFLILRSAARGPRPECAVPCCVRVRGLCSVQEHRPSGGDHHGSRCAALGLAARCRTTVRTVPPGDPFPVLPLAGSHPVLVRWPAPARPALAGVPSRASTNDHGVLHRPRDHRPGISQSVPDRQGALWHAPLSLSRGTEQLTGKSQVFHRLSPSCPQDLPWQARTGPAERASHVARFGSVHPH